MHDARGPAGRSGFAFSGLVSVEQRQDLGVECLGLLERDEMSGPGNDVPSRGTDPLVDRPGMGVYVRDIELSHQDQGGLVSETDRARPTSRGSAMWAGTSGGKWKRTSHAGS